MNGVARRRQRLWIVAAFLAVAMGVIVGVVAYVKLSRELPEPHFASDQDHFLFASTGNEREHGVPYWIWLVLPRIFPEHLPRPGGYAALGVVGMEGREMPAGFSKVTIGYPRVGINCAFCHTARWRERPGDPPTIVPTGPGHQTGAQEYMRFLIACASDPRFNAGTILGEIAKNYRLSLLERALYRFVIIPSTRRRLLALDRENGWTRQRPDWGRGRSDVLNHAKFSLLRQPADSTVGTADTVPLWNLKQHSGMALFWDGSNTNLREAVTWSVLASGATRSWIDDRNSSLERVVSYVSAIRPPPYPFAVDQAAAQKGAAVFAAACAQCHAFGGARTGKVIPIAEIGTDRQRLDAWTGEAAAASNALGGGVESKFSAFRKTDGYVAVPLDGVWLRAPYLHNGSVPSLGDLLEPAERRPVQFWRGYDVYDPVKVGFVSEGPEARRIGTSHDATKPGNSNAGHVFGTQLGADEKRVLLEFLKTQ
jgi:mono/diheme cytochrome c family protein